MAYEEFFGLKDTPFRLTPDPEYYFPSDVHKEALQTLLYSIRAGEGFVQITGEPGTGKTLILRTIMRQLGSKVTTALILNPSLSPSELLRVILEDLGLDPLQTEEKPKEALLRYFRDTLLEKARHGIKTVIIIDEAQNLPNETMEELRLLSNLETEKEKLLQIILVGQVELEKKLRNPELKQLNQRITIRYRLKPLSKQDAIAYIYHRINVAGGGEHIRFSPRVLERIYKLSGGVPRMINIICERALMAAFVESKNTIAMTQVKKAMESIAGEEEPRRHRAPQWVGYAAAVVFITVLGAAVGWYLYGPIDVGKSLLTADISGSPALMTRDGGGMVQQLKTVISEKEAEAENRDAELRKKVNELEQKVSTLSQKETLLQEKEYLLREKEADLSQKEVVLVEKEDSLSEKEEQLRQAERSIGEKKEGLTHKETILSEKEETLIKKEELLAKKAAAVEATGSVFPPVDSMAVAVSCSIPKGNYVVLLDTRTKNASIWQGTDSQPLLKGEFAYEWPLGEGLFIVGKDAVMGEFVFHHMSFFWGSSSVRDAKLWGKIEPFVDVTNVALLVYSPRTIAAIMGKGDNNASEQGKIIKKTIFAWADAWIKKQIDILITFYGSLFTNYYLQMDKPLVFTREQFYLLKKDVLDKSGAISLTISDPLCIVNPENPHTAIAVFKQSYRSAIYSDDGTKVLYFAATDGPAGTQTWKIVAKLWLPSEANE